MSSTTQQATPSRADMQLVLASKRYIRMAVTLWTGLMVVGAAYTLVRGIGAASLPVPLLDAIVLAILGSWVAYVVRLHTVVRLDAHGISVRRLYPPLEHAYPWPGLLEWRRAERGRGKATLRLTFSDGRRVTIYPAAYEHADELQQRLEMLLPGSGTRVRVGRRPEHVVPAT